MTKLKLDYSYIYIKDDKSFTHKHFTRLKVVKMHNCNAKKKHTHKRYLVPYILFTKFLLNCCSHSIYGLVKL